MNNNNKSQGQGYIWRPNDNSATTITKYSLEAEHWTKAFRSAAMKNSPSIGGGVGVFGVIALILSLIMNLIWIVFYVFTSIIVWVFKPREGRSNNVSESTEPRALTDNEIDSMFNDNTKKVRNIYE